MDELRPRGPGRFVLRALAITSALGFLALVMVQAMAFYAPSPEPRKKTLHGLLGPATKAAPVVHPPTLVEPQDPQDGAYLGGTKSMTVIPPTLLAPPREPSERRALLPATKAGILGPLKVSPPASPPQQQATPRPRD
jgi:hypothetical protein